MRPTFDDLVRLPRGSGPLLTEADMDGNGHLTVHDHVRIAAHGAHTILTAAGMTPERRDNDGMSVFTAEHHVRYRHELRFGTTARVHTRLVDMSDKVVHLVGYLVDVDARRSATELEALVVAIDLTTRKAAPFPDDVRAALRNTHAAHAALDWTPSLSGAIAVRH